MLRLPKALLFLALMSVRIEDDRYDDDENNCHGRSSCDARTFQQDLLSCYRCYK